ncbi:Hypp3481 [Branchiostoma lanceolatum]|uniref:Hypp3481 protein n=1 Tax=Branchiostoma lanceolatum TaxID=7740 RepID=A0A8K0EXX5_BRALA|nr:Hypp3481 [Branchiostoma lanceolatum]
MVFADNWSSCQANAGVVHSECSTRYDTPSCIKVVYRGFSASAPEEIALRIERGVRRCSRSPRMVAASGSAGLSRQPYACHSEGGATRIVAFWAGF